MYIYIYIEIQDSLQSMFVQPLGGPLLSAAPQTAHVSGLMCSTPFGRRRRWRAPLGPSSTTAIRGCLGCRREVPGVHIVSLVLVTGSHTLRTRVPQTCLKGSTCSFHVVDHDQYL